jgi:hypothetical protein
VIRFTYRDKEDREHLCVGISAENVKRLKDGKPLCVNVAEMGLAVNGSIVVFYGDTEQTLYESIKEFIGPDTKVNIDPRVAVKP